MLVTGEKKSQHQTKRILLLAMWFVLYLNVGGLVFSYLEKKDVESSVRRPLQPWVTLEELLSSGRIKNVSDSEWIGLKSTAVQSCSANRTQLNSMLDDWVQRSRPPLSEVMETCGNGSYIVSSETIRTHWSFISAVYFCMTVVSTIGYGHIYPASAGGQVFCIIYALFGIPCSGMLLASLSDLFSGSLLAFYNCRWSSRMGSSRWSLAIFTSLYMALGLVLLVFIPAVAFTMLEEWNYRESVYYAFITISTIGFGDFTAAKSEDDAWSVVYKVIVMLWMLIGLGYWILVLDFLQKTMKSKELAKTLSQTRRMIAKEAQEIRQALADVGLLHRDAVFVPERSKKTMNMMINMGNMLVSMGDRGAGEETGDGGVKVDESVLEEVNSIRNSLRNNSVLAVLMASMTGPVNDDCERLSETSAPDDSKVIWE